MQRLRERLPASHDLSMTFDPKALVSRIRVPAGFFFAALYLYFSTPSAQSLWMGGSLAFIGILIRAWATGHIRKNDELTVSGPYALTRNPLYFGSFVIGVGFSVAGANPIIIAVFLACFTAIYLPVVRQEIEHLKLKFPKQYERYQATVPVFFPRVALKSLGQERFSFHRYLKHREYRALIGFVAALSFLILKLHQS
ncbi:MAG: isoprenylcysteine carboxylmethyltransferase family protein [Acidimicrobiia bacterium]|nr:isoprenylcysteine carboxylmethyltransferase family protein [Acidimicrobiia bacterium]